MTDQPNDPRDRFRTLDRQDAPDLWSEATARAKATPASTSWLPRFGGGLAVAAVVVVGVIIGLQLAGPGSQTPGGPLPSPSDGDVVTASVVEGDYQLTITAPKATWATDEAIEVEATLKYLGAEESVELWGSGGGLIGFGLNELTGDKTMGPAFQADCTAHTISPSEPITAPFEKSGGYSPEDPDADFWEAFFADPEFRLPGGDWEVTASASFDAGDTCTASPTSLSVEITLTVEGPSVEPSGEPSESAEPSVEPSVEPTPELPQFACDTPISLTAAGSSLHPLLTQDIRVGTHDGFDRIVFEYDGGTPFLEIRSVLPPLVYNPSGEPIEVAGSRLYAITLTGATKWDLSGDPAVLVYDGPTDFKPGYPQIVQFVEFGDFEATHSWYLGANGGECLRAFTLNDPRRLVIDIQH